MKIIIWLLNIFIMKPIETCNLFTLKKKLNLRMHYQAPAKVMRFFSFPFFIYLHNVFIECFSWCEIKLHSTIGLFVTIAHHLLTQLQISILTELNSLLKHVFCLFQVNVLCRGAYILTIDFIFLIYNIDTLKIKSRSYRK